MDLFVRLEEAETAQRETAGEILETDSVGPYTAKKRDADDAALRLHEDEGTPTIISALINRIHPEWANEAEAESFTDY